MSIQRRHLKSLGLVIDSDMLHPKVRKDLVLIYDTLDKELKSKGNKLTHQEAVELENKMGF